MNTYTAVTGIELEVIRLASDPSNWERYRDAIKKYKLNKNIMDKLIQKRKLPEYVGLERCYRKLGRNGFINIRIFGLWQASLLPEQQPKN